MTIIENHYSHYAVAPGELRPGGFPPSLPRQNSLEMLAAAFLSSAGFSPSLRTAAPLTAAQPRCASLMMSQPQRPSLELPAKLLDLGCDAELWSQVQPHHERPPTHHECTCGAHVGTCGAHAVHMHVHMRCPCTRACGAHARSRVVCMRCACGVHAHAVRVRSEESP